MPFVLVVQIGDSLEQVLHTHLACQLLQVVSSQRTSCAAIRILDLWYLRERQTKDNLRHLEHRCYFVMLTVEHALTDGPVEDVVAVPGKPN